MGHIQTLTSWLKNKLILLDKQKWAEREVSESPKIAIEKGNSCYCGIYQTRGFNSLDQSSRPTDV